MIKLCRAFLSQAAHDGKRQKLKVRRLKPVIPIPHAPNEAAKNAWKGFNQEGAGKPVKEYYDERVQEILKRLVGRSAHVLKNRYIPRSPATPEYKLVRPEKLHELNEDIDRLLTRYLQVIPMYTPRVTAMDVTIQECPQLAHFDTSKYVFTDVSLSKSKRDRTVVVRHPDGSLKYAPWEVRDRIHIVYFGDDGHVFPLPSFIRHTTVLNEALKSNKHLYILECTVSLCEPDDPYYIRVFKNVFLSIIRNEKYHLLELTPFYAPLMFFAAREPHLISCVIKYYLHLKSMHPDPDVHDFPLILRHLNLYDLMDLYILLTPNSLTALASQQHSKEDLFKIFLNELQCN